MTSSLTLTRKDSIGIITFDQPGSKLNVISTTVADEFEGLLDTIEDDEHIKAIVLISGKPDSFIAGANIEEFLTFKTVEDAAALSRKAQSLANRLDSSPKPVVCAINGACLGGGLEMALACDYRIATDHPKTQLALPEVMLGLLPGAGGTQRLPRLIGVATALSMMLTGRRVKSNEAKRIGLVDHIAPPAGLLEIACKAATRLINGSLQIDREKKKQSLSQSFLETRAGSWVAMRKARADVESKTRGNYPAPAAIIDAVEFGLRRPLSEGLDFEAQKFGELSQTLQSKNLISLFFMQTSHKKNVEYKTHLEASRIGVLGAGFMGSGIALVSLQSDFDVVLSDVSTEALGRAEKSIESELAAKVKRKSSSELEKSQTLARLSLASALHKLKDCDIVIEAVFEDLELKRNLLAELEPHLHDNCVFASNTSALPIHEIARDSARKDRIVGMHYFSPVHKMPLLEVVRTKESSQDAIGLAVNVGLAQGKTIIVVRDAPGFYTSRILAPFLDEAAAVALEGIGPHEIDLYMEQFGFPVGPITLMDEVGIDVAAHVAKELIPHFGSRFATADWGAMELMMEKKLLGRKTKRGFYLYEGGGSPLTALKSFGRDRKPVNPQMREIFRKYARKPVLKSITAHDIQLRLALRMVNEAVYCLQEEILHSPADGDIGAVFGLGFPPFMGGPFHYVDKEGPGKVVANLTRFADHFGAHFAPAPLLVDMAKHGKKFY